MKKKIVLASTSRYRADLLARMQISFDITNPNADESPLANERPEHTALRLSVAKARSVCTSHPGSLIIGSDQVAELNGLPIGKPGTRDAARRQLQSMRGQLLLFHSGIALVDADTGRAQSAVVTTAVRFRHYSERELENYLDHENALDCAGSAKSEGLGIALIASVQSDDPTALVGLPLIQLTTMLLKEGFGVLG